MDDFVQPKAPKLENEVVLQPDDMAPMDETSSQFEAVAPQTFVKESSQSRKKSSRKVGLIVSAVALAFALFGGMVGFVLGNRTAGLKTGQVSDKNGEIGEAGDGDNKNDSINDGEKDNPDAKPDNDKVSNTEAEVGNVNNAFQGRLYLLDGSDGAFHKQRYYLLVDNATYGLNEDFLQRKTYVMDLAAVGSSDFIREVDLSAIMAPIVETYISEHQRENCETCSVEYFGYHNPMMIDFEKELIFQTYYHCTVYGGGELSLGSRQYAFNVETNEIKDMGPSS